MAKNNDELSLKIQEQGGKPTPLALGHRMKTWFEKNQPRITTLMGNRSDAERLYLTFMHVASKSPQIVQADPITVQEALLQCAELKLWPGPLKQAAIVCYWNKKKNCYDAQMMPQYQGILDLCYRAGAIVPPTEIEIVYANDHFKFVKGLNPDLQYTPFEGPAEQRGERRGAYTILTTARGHKIFNFYPIDKIWRYRNQSQSYQRAKEKKDKGEWFAESFWLSDNPDTVDWMIKKTALKQELKLIPMSVDLARAIEKDDAIEQGKEESKGIFDVEAIDVTPGAEADNSGAESDSSSKA